MRKERAAVRRGVSGAHLLQDPGLALGIHSLHKAAKQNDNGQKRGSDTDRRRIEVIRESKNYR